MNGYAYDPRSADDAWRGTLFALLDYGYDVQPRGKPTIEIPHQTICVDLARSIVTNPARRLSYPYAAAEAAWILDGDDRVDSIAPFNRRIAEYSDDGERFFGAYGPPLVDQLPHVVDTLYRDEYSRQAGVTIWRRKPPQSKDVPCTIAAWFLVRHGRVHVHVFMRSSDSWLGLPYDIFTFATWGWYVVGRLNEQYTEPFLRPGALFLTAASRHLYLTNRDHAVKAVEAWQPDTPVRPAPPGWWTEPHDLAAKLWDLARTKRGDERRWWETKP